MNLTYQTEHLLKNHIRTLISLKGGHSEKQVLSEHEIHATGQALLSLQRGLTGDRTLAGAGYMNTSVYRTAYLLYYWPVSYVQISYVLSFAEKTITALAEKVMLNHGTLNILDLGAGPAPASCALADFLAGKKYGLPDITLADTSRTVLNLAKQIMKTEYPSISVTTIEADFEQTDTPAETLSLKKYDIIIMSHALNELWKTSPDAIERRVLFLKKYASLLSEDGIMCLVEPALQETSRNLLHVRDKFMADGWHTIAPCTGDGQCPALSAGPGHTCHGYFPWNPPEPVESLAKNAGLDRDAVKMTFCIIQPPLNTTPYKTETTTVSGRIVSDGMLNKAGRIRFLLCDGKQRIPFSARKDDPRATAQGFFSLHRYDYITIENPELRGADTAQSLGFGNETQIHLQ